MRLEMLNNGQAIRVIKGTIQEHVKQNGPITRAGGIGHLPHDIFAGIVGAMVQMTQEEIPDGALLTRELKELRAKWEAHKLTIDYWMQRARNAEARLVQLGETPPDPPKVKPPKEKTHEAIENV
jgi:hypothetical protein